MTAEKDPNKWVVSRNRNAALSRARTANTDTERFRTLSNALRDLPTEDDVVEEVGKLWAEAQEKFLTIGRYLVRAKARFHRTFEATILPQLPFGKGVAYQLRAVAVTVDEGRILEEEIPHSYATAYQLASLSPADLDLARKENLVRRDVLRREVEAFRAKLNAKPSDLGAELVREWQHLRGEIARMQARVAEIEQEIGPQLRERGVLVEAQVQG